MPLARLRMDELVNAWVGDANTPFQLGLLGVFDAGRWRRTDDSIAVEDLAEQLAARARGVQQMRRRVLWTRPGEGRPVWVGDSALEVAAHVGSCTLPAGHDLLTWAANRSVRPLDLDRPLWRAEVVDGLPDGGFAVLVVLHHILADGVAGVRMAGALFDLAPDTVRADAPPATDCPVPSHRDLVRDRFTRRGRPHPRRRLPARTAEKAGGRHPMAGFLNAIEGFRTPLPATSLPRRVGSGRRMVAVTVRLELVRTAGHALGATVNDLVLAAVTDGLRDLLLSRGEPIEGVFLRATVPAGTGGAGQAMGMLVVDLPVGEPDPSQRLTLIHAATTTGKARLRASGGEVTDILHVPLPMARAIVSWGRRLGSTRVNLGVSDVPGPTAPLWLAGARMGQALPIAPLVPLVPISVAALSYAGSLAVTVNADASVTDLDVVADGMARSFQQYTALATQTDVPGSR
jgi:diacylglycerol O-acyltransferase